VQGEPFHRLRAATDPPQIDRRGAKPFVFQRPGEAIEGLRTADARHQGHQIPLAANRDTEVDRAHPDPIRPHGSPPIAGD
jgi:hypothetical protein